MTTLVSQGIGLDALKKRSKMQRAAGSIKCEAAPIIFGAENVSRRVNTLRNRQRTGSCSLEKTLFKKIQMPHHGYYLKIVCRRVEALQSLFAPSLNVNSSDSPNVQ